MLRLLKFHQLNFFDIFHIQNISFSRYILFFSNILKIQIDHFTKKNVSSRLGLEAGTSCAEGKHANNHWATQSIVATVPYSPFFHSQNALTIIHCSICLTAVSSCAVSTLHFNALLVPMFIRHLLV